jgi:hypothetical protein
MAIRYSRIPRWKYRTAAEYRVDVGFFKTKAERGNDYVWLGLGTLTIAKGYAWDGPSGPTVDTKNWMRASLVHDALYQLMREGFIDLTLRAKTDDLMYAHLREDGMSRPRARTAYYGVRIFGEKHARPRPAPKVLIAP